MRTRRGLNCIMCMLVTIFRMVSAREHRHTHGRTTPRERKKQSNQSITLAASMEDSNGYRQANIHVCMENHKVTF